MIKKRKEIVIIGFAESLAAIETVFNLLDGGFNVYAFTRKKKALPLNKCKSIKILEIPAPEESADSAEMELINIIKSINADFLMPLDDASLWLCNKIRGKVKSKFVGPKESAVNLALDKQLQVEAAKKAGFNIPTTKIIEKVDKLLSIDYFPVIVKPALAVRLSDGRLQKGNIIIGKNKHDLANFAKSWHENEPLLVQPFIPGTGEGIFGYYNINKGGGWSMHKRLRMMNPLGSGSSACYSIPVDENIKKITNRFLQRAAWKGIFMIELLKAEDGTTWFMEINGRTWGSMALAIRQGLDYPVWAIKGTLDPTFMPKAKPKEADIVARHMGREIVHLLMVMRGSKSKRVRKWPSRLQTIKDIFTIKQKDRFYNYRKGEKTIFFKDTIKTVKEQIFKK